MNSMDFRAPEAGRVIHTSLGYAAFVPALLPPEITYTGKLVLALSRADQALSDLSGLGRLPNTHILIASYVRREAVLSSRIDDTRTSVDELLRDEVESNNERGKDSVLQIRSVHSEFMRQSHTPPHHVFWVGLGTDGGSEGTWRGFGTA